MRSLGLVEEYRRSELSPEIVQELSPYEKQIRETNLSILKEEMRHKLSLLRSEDLENEYLHALVDAAMGAGFTENLWEKHSEITLGPSLQAKLFEGPLLTCHLQKQDLELYGLQSDFDRLGPEKQKELLAELRAKRRKDIEEGFLKSLRRDFPVTRTVAANLTLQP